MTLLSPRQRDDLERLCAPDGSHGVARQPPQRRAITARCDERPLHAATSSAGLGLWIGARLAGSRSRSTRAPRTAASPWCDACHSTAARPTL